MASLLDVTPEEQHVIDELKRRTINDVSPKMLEDESLFYRFSKARDYKLADAEAMLRGHIAFRKSLDMDNIFTNYTPPEVIVKHIPTSVLGFDKEGCIVRYTDCGQTDLLGLWKCVTKKDLLKYFCLIVERIIQTMREQSKKHGKMLTKSVEIFDFQKFKLSTATHYKTILYFTHYLKIYTDNYPELLKYALVINTPLYFGHCWSMFKTVIPAVVIQKIRFDDKGVQLKQLLEDIDADVLPAFLGGTRTDPDGDPLCKTIILYGEPVPEYYFRDNCMKRLSIAPDVKKITLSAGYEKEIIYEVEKKSSLLEWEFQTKKKDIEFALYFKEAEGSMPEELVPKAKIDTSLEPEKGLFRCEKQGIYIIVFDNTNSYFTPKEIYYRTRLLSPAEVELQ
ncbi:SEC14-like protein 2 [Caerostris darwini]|uniref:SEC14-like protein 2 n=1 Tax=Caerostris darwini TaxID=1538125 RepID=A0AAV4X4X8_9ARAC|nr:SEC14-like protein 2 [Caerostris darwini]